eukprot:m.256432 g.256432  ORF g.256432 m.256432 type:complete len:105 (+) comp34369_c0_seq1:76-390(+)
MESTTTPTIKNRKKKRKKKNLLQTKPPQKTKKFKMKEESKPATQSICFNRGRTGTDLIEVAPGTAEERRLYKCALKTGLATNDGVGCTRCVLARNVAIARFTMS